MNGLEDVRCEVCGLGASLPGILVQAWLVDHGKECSALVGAVADSSNLSTTVGDLIIKGKTLTNWANCAGIWFEKTVVDIMEFNGTYYDCFWMLRSTYEAHKGEYLGEHGKHLGYYVAWKSDLGVFINIWHRSIKDFIMTGLFPPEADKWNEFILTGHEHWSEKDFQTRQILFGRTLG